VAHQRNSPDEWIRRDGAFTAIVPVERFLEVQAVIADRCSHLDEGQMLSMLTQLLDKYGALSGLIIDEEDGLPSSSAYRNRFGSLMNAYQLVGFTPRRDYAYLEINRALRRMHPEVLAEVSAGIVSAGGVSRRDPATDLLTINDEFTTSLVIARCKPTLAGTNRWRVRLDTSLEPDITVVLRMDHANRRAFDYYVLPCIDFSASALPIRESNGFSLDAYRMDSLDFFYSLTTRVPVQEAA